MNASATTFQPAKFKPENLNELVGDDQAAQQRLLKIFIETASQTFEDLIKHVQHLDFSGIATSAHKLKSSALAIGATEFVDFLQTAENAAKAGDEDLFQQSIESFRETFELLIKEIELYLQ